MALIKLNLEASKSQLRWFGVLLWLYFLAVGSLCRFVFDAPTFGAWVWAIGTLLGLAYYALPGLRLTMYRTWMRAFFPVGWLMSHTALVLTYYVVTAPIGMILRLVRQAQSRGS